MTSKVGGTNPSASEREFNALVNLTSGVRQDGECLHRGAGEFAYLGGRDVARCKR